LNDVREKKFYYLDLHPDKVVNGKRKYQRRSLLRWGPPRCFREEDLYTTRFGQWESTEIEQKFFGRIDSLGKPAVEHFSTFEHPSVDEPSFHNLLLFLSIQKLRTPKGLATLADLVKLSDKNLVLLKVQELQQLFCAFWTESVWSIVDASQSETKFLLSDHPVTVYNGGCFPGSKWCQGHRDPGVWLTGTHTLFPLNLEKMLIFTNLSWVRNPYANPLESRPNPAPFRTAIFNFLQIQTRRSLTEREVIEINYIIKKRAYRYLAAAKEEWLYPEKSLSTQHWSKFGDGYLLMPDPRSVTFTTGMYVGYQDGTSIGFDEYGRKPWQKGYQNKEQQEREWETFQAFKGEYARLFGPKRRGRAFEGMELDNEEDSQEYHSYNLKLEQKYGKFRHKPKRKRKG